MPARNEALLTFVAGEPYVRSRNVLPYRLDEDEDLVERWSVDHRDRCRFGRDAGRHRAVPRGADPRGRRGASRVRRRRLPRPRGRGDRPGRPSRARSSVSRRVLIGSLLAFLVARRRIIKPVQAVETTARTISESDLSRRIEVSGDDEIAHLAETFNDLLGAPRASVRGPARLRRRRRPRAPHPDHDHPRAARAPERRPGTAAPRGRARHGRARPDEPDGERPAPAREGTATRVPPVRPRRRRITDARGAREGRRTGRARSGGSTRRRRRARRRPAAARAGLDPAAPERGRLHRRRTTRSRSARGSTTGGRGSGYATAARGSRRRCASGSSIASARIGSRQSDGAGLGLSIVRTIAEGHGGRVWVESEVGEGSTFTIEVPVEQDPAGTEVA